MKARTAAIALVLALLMGCSTKEEQLQQQLAQTQQDRDAVKSQVADRDAYLEQVIRSVNEVYADLEQARIKEGKLLNRAEGAEGTAMAASNLDTRQKLLADISDIGSVLKENRKRIATLEASTRASRRKIAGLDTLIAQLKQTLIEREQSIAQLQGQVQGLQATVAENTKTIEEKSAVIDDQQKRLNTAYYVVGTRDELKKKGIIDNEGGFLWGLLGSTTVLKSGIDSTEFTPIDKTSEGTIHVTGRVDEIIPHRQDAYYAMAEPDQQNTDLTIINPGKFWQDRYLVIVTD